MEESKMTYPKGILWLAPNAESHKPNIIAIRDNSAFRARALGRLSKDNLKPKKNVMLREAF